MNNISRDADEKAPAANQNDVEKPDQTKNGEAQPENVAGAAANGKVTETSLEAQLAEAQAKAAEYLDGWQRARADFVNYRKRSEQERADAYSNATVDTLRRLLPVIDDFDRALANVPADK